MTALLVLAGASALAFAASFAVRVLLPDWRREVDGDGGGHP